MPNTGFGMRQDMDHRLRHELTRIQRIRPRCSTKSLVVTPLQTGKQVQYGHARANFD